MSTKQIDTPFHILTISGLPGSGNSSVSAQLAKKLLLPILNIGDIFKKQMALVGPEEAKHFETDYASDFLLDNKIKEACFDALLNNTSLIIDAKRGAIIAQKIAEHSPLRYITVFLTASDIVRTKRIAHRQNTSDLDTVAIQINARMNDFILRLKKLNVLYPDEGYDCDVYDPKAFSYDLIIDTSNISIEDSVNKITNFLTIEK